MQKSRKVQAVIALSIVFAFLALCGWQVIKTGTLEPEFKQALIIALSVSYGYYLGSSDGSARKTDIIEPTVVPTLPPKE